MMNWDVELMDEFTRSSIAKQYALLLHSHPGSWPNGNAANHQIVYEGVSTMQYITSSERHTVPRSLLSNWRGRR